MIYSIMETWSHLCNSDNVFYNLPLKQVCRCGLSHQVQSLRYEGFSPSPLIPTKKKAENLPLRRRVAALFMPKATPRKITDENQHDYYDRQG